MLNARATAGISGLVLVNAILLATQVMLNLPIPPLV